MSPWSNWKPALGQWSTSKKRMTSMRSELEPAIWSSNTGQQMPCFDRCQLIIKSWMSNIREVQGITRLNVSVNLFEVWPPCCATVVIIISVVMHTRPRTIPLSHDNHEKINSWVSFSFPHEYGALLDGLSGRWSSSTNIASIFPPTLTVLQTNDRKFKFCCCKVAGIHWANPPLNVD